jgi:ribosome-binding factor A
MPSKIRLKRISDRIRDDLSAVLLTEVQDPRLSGISVTDVRVDRELAFADIFVSAVEGQERSKEVLQGMRSAAGFLRRALAARVDLRVFPILRFHWDPTPERADHIERILASIRTSEVPTPVEDEVGDEDGVDTDLEADERDDDE